MKRLGLIKSNVARLMALPLLASLLSCQAPQQSACQAENLTARELVEQNVFLETPEVESRSASDWGLSPIGRAACYRFYKNVSYDENNIGTCTAKASDLNMSEEIFDDFMRDLEWLNEAIRRDLARGVKGQMSPKDDKYFACLLDDELFENMMKVPNPDFLKEVEKEFSER